MAPQRDANLLQVVSFWRDCEGVKTRSAQLTPCAVVRLLLPDLVVPLWEPNRYASSRMHLENLIELVLYGNRLEERHEEIGHPLAQVVASSDVKANR